MEHTPGVVKLTEVYTGDYYHGILDSGTYRSGSFHCSKKASLMAPVEQRESIVLVRLNST